MFEKIRKKVLKLDQLSVIRAEHIRKRIVFCTGCYDILQTGHAVFFSQCKEEGDILVVGVGSDMVIQELKGPGRPINPQNNRVYLVAALGEVDYAVINSDTYEEGKIDFREIVEQLRPDIFVLNDDDSAVENKKTLCDRLNIKMITVAREVPPELEATSTTRIIDKINFAYKAPLRIDLAGGWTDIPQLMQGNIGYVSNIAIKPHVELKAGVFNLGGYPRGSGLSTSTAVESLKMISAKNYNAESKTLEQIAEDLYQFENKELNWLIGRQDQYAIVYGGFHCFEFNLNYGKSLNIEIKDHSVDTFCSSVLLLHTGVSRNAQIAVEDVYKNYNTSNGIEALKELAVCGKAFAIALSNDNYDECAEIMNRNFKAQKKLAASTSNEHLEEIYQFALNNGALGGKICGAGGGGAFVFYCKSDKKELLLKIKKKFSDCFELSFELEKRNIKELNVV